MSDSIRFDQAVEYYDATRTLPDDVVARQKAQLEAELGGRGQLLEVGIGTGRVAVTLDVPIIGLDLSRPMMEVLRTKSTRIPLVEADAVRLPFPDNAFGAALAAHVLQLIPAWETALAELARVVRPGGVVLLARASGRSDVDAELRRQTAIPRRTPGADGLEEVDAAAHRIGLGVRTLDATTWESQCDVGAEVRHIEQRVWSGLWELDDETIRAAADRVRAWATERFGSADVVVPATTSFAWHAYDVP